MGLIMNPSSGSILCIAAMRLKRDIDRYMDGRKKRGKKYMCVCGGSDVNVSYRGTRPINPSEWMDVRSN